MKFPQMPYRRPDLAAIEEKTAGILRQISAAASAEEQARAYLDFEALERETSTACTLASIRHTIDTRDSFYDQENDYVDEIARPCWAPPSGGSWRSGSGSSCSPTWRSAPGP